MMHAALCLPPSLCLPPLLNPKGRPLRTTQVAAQHKGVTRTAKTSLQINPGPGNNGLERSSLSTHPLPRAFHISNCCSLPKGICCPPTNPTAHTLATAYVHMSQPPTQQQSCWGGGRESAASSCCTHCCHTGKAAASQKRHQCGSAKWQAAVHSNQAPAPCPTGTGRVRPHTHTRAYPPPPPASLQAAWHVVSQGMAQVLAGSALTELMPMNRRATGNRR